MFRSILWLIGQCENGDSCLSPHGAAIVLIAAPRYQVAAMPFFICLLIASHIFLTP